MALRSGKGGPLSLFTRIAPAAHLEALHDFTAGLSVHRSLSAPMSLPFVNKSRRFFPKLSAEAGSHS